MSAQVTAQDFPEIRWRGQWIWCPEEPIVPNPALIPTVDFRAKEAHGLFRKTLHLDGVPERVPARVTADSRVCPVRQRTRGLPRADSQSAPPAPL